MKEVWKDIPILIDRYKGLYQVSNLGRLRSLQKKTSYILKDRKHSTQKYRVIDIGSHPDKKSYLVHRLVASAFIDNFNNLPEVNHKDFDPTNNNVLNLEWIDRKSHVEYNLRHNRIARLKGSSNPNVKISEEAVFEIIKRFTNGESIKSISESMDISRYIVSDIKNNRSWKHIPRTF